MRSKSGCSEEFTHRWSHSGDHGVPKGVSLKEGKTKRSNKWGPQRGTPKRDPTRVVQKGGSRKGAPRGILQEGPPMGAQKGFPGVFPKGCSPGGSTK
jgi:hypothetical protein